MEMAQAQTKTTSGSLMDDAKRMGDDLFKVGRNVFLAGLGVVASTEEQARDMFDRLRKKGEEYRKDEDRIFVRATQEARELGSRFEQRFQKTVTGTLNRAGMPSRDEVRQLIERVEKLTRKVDDLAK
jgi:poly(hydroxyalkanoate) granule-associated protein